MLDRIPRYFLTSLLLLGACSVFAAQPPAASPQAKRASVMDVGTVYLSNQLFQMAYSEYDVLRDRHQGTRFIPHQVEAYYLPEPSGKNIHIVATYRNADPTVSEKGAQEICEGMLKWIRFHLRVSDNGQSLSADPKQTSSTLFQFITPSDVDPNAYQKEWALALDKQTIIMGVVPYIGPSGGSSAGCKLPLTEPRESRKE